MSNISYCYFEGTYSYNRVSYTLNEIFNQDIYLLVISQGKTQINFSAGGEDRLSTFRVVVPRVYFTNEIFQNIVDSISNIKYLEMRVILDENISQQLSAKSWATNLIDAPLDDIFNYIDKVDEIIVIDDMDLSRLEEYPHIRLRIEKNNIAEILEILQHIPKATTRLSILVNCKNSEDSWYQLLDKLKTFTELQELILYCGYKTVFIPHDKLLLNLNIFSTNLEFVVEAFIMQSSTKELYLDSPQIILNSIIESNVYLIKCKNISCLMDDEDTYLNSILERNANKIRFARIKSARVSNDI